MVYNVTDYINLYTGKLPVFNETTEMSMHVENGTGHMINGYVSAFCKVEGMDLQLQLQLAIVVLLAILTLMVSVYVAIYIWRYVNHD